MACLIVILEFYFHIVSPTLPLLSVLIGPQPRPSHSPPWGIASASHRPWKPYLDSPSCATVTRNFLKHSFDRVTAAPFRAYHRPQNCKQISSCSLGPASHLTHPLALCAPCCIIIPAEIPPLRRASALIPHSTSFSSRPQSVPTAVLLLLQNPSFLQEAFSDLTRGHYFPVPFNLWHVTCDAPHSVLGGRESYLSLHVVSS